ncbi:hypothetical protein [Ignatzschineria sp. LJL83]
MKEEELRKKILEYHRVSSSINLILISYQDDINNIFLKIKLSGYLESECLFDKLFYIQKLLSEIKYKYKYNFSRVFDNFIYFFDRDDEHSRKFLYKKLQDSTNLGMNMSFFETLE